MASHLLDYAVSAAGLVIPAGVFANTTEERVAKALVGKHACVVCGVAVVPRVGRDTRAHFVHPRPVPAGCTPSAVEHAACVRYVADNHRRLRVLRVCFSCGRDCPAVTFPATSTATRRPAAQSAAAAGDVTIANPGSNSNVSASAVDDPDSADASADAGAGAGDSGVIAVVDVADDPFAPGPHDARPPCDADTYRLSVRHVRQAIATRSFTVHDEAFPSAACELCTVAQADREAAAAERKRQRLEQVARLKAEAEAKEKRRAEAEYEDVMQNCLSDLVDKDDAAAPTSTSTTATLAVDASKAAAAAAKAAADAVAVAAAMADPWRDLARAIGEDPSVAAVEGEVEGAGVTKSSAPKKKRVRRKRVRPESYDDEAYNRLPGGAHAEADAPGDYTVPRELWSAANTKVRDLPVDALLRLSGLYAAGDALVDLTYPPEDRASWSDDTWKAHEAFTAVSAEHQAVVDVCRLHVLAITVCWKCGREPRSEKTNPESAGADEDAPPPPPDPEAEPAGAPGNDGDVVEDGDRPQELHVLVGRRMCRPACPSAQPPTFELVRKETVCKARAEADRPSDARAAPNNRRLRKVARIADDDDDNDNGDDGRAAGEAGDHSSSAL